MRIREILGPAMSTVLRTAGFVVGLVVIPVWLFFVLKDRERLPGGGRARLPEAGGRTPRNVMALFCRRRRPLGARPARSWARRSSWPPSSA